MNHRPAIIVLIALGWIPVASAQRPIAPKPSAAQEKPTAPAEPDTEKMTDADRVARIQRAIDDSQAQLTQLRESLNDPNGEYKKAEAEFSNLDGQFDSERKEIQRLKGEGGSDVTSREAALGDLEKKRVLAKERFDLAIRERKAVQDKVALLEQKLQQDREALNKLLGVPDAKAPASTGEGKEASGAGTQQGTTDSGSGTAKVAEPASAAPSQTTPAGASASAPTSGPAPEAASGAGPLTAPAQAVAPSAAPSSGGAGPVKLPSEQVIKAQEAASSKQAEADQAKQQAMSATQRLDSIRKVIQNEQELRRTARQKADNIGKTLKALGIEQDKKLAEGVRWSQLGELHSQIDDATNRLNEVTAEIQKRGETLDERHAELAALQSEQIAALEEAKKKMEEAEAARATLADLKNPFAPANIWNWVVQHGSKIGGTILTAMILLWLIQVMEHRMIRLITHHGMAGTQEDRESRARTLAGVLQNLFTVMVVIGAFLIVIAELGFNIATILGATAVLGLAVAFGAQNLIRDYFYGFMILMENQYLVNDVVRIGPISGQVERITLRITVLRDLRGTVHFVPHGQITTVSNLTRGWARVVLDVDVAYKEDVDRVMKVLADLGKEIRRDPAYRDLILDEPEISGVDALKDSSVVVRFLIKTRPLKQWTIKREMLRRIKNKFDEVGIEIPFPQQVVYNRFDENAAEQARLLASPRPGEVEEWTTPQSAAG